MPQTVAIIMRARNEMPHVRRALASLQRQTLKTYDLFAVDSGSSDGTLEALQAHCNDGHLSTIPPESYVPGRVLNDAVARTTHDYIILLNADAVPAADDFLETLIQPLANGRADAVYARQIARPDARFIVNYDFERAYRPAKPDPVFFSAVACAFRRSLWERHTFRNEGYAEDQAWARACIADGARFALVPEAVVEHSHNYTLKELYQKRYRQAVTFNRRPALLKQAGRCMRETARDLLHTIRRMKLHTIPYNVVYRITLHAAEYRGVREGAS